ncbi:L-serine ammonia-lyase, iron-sulfur-dependent, subunit alpha [Desulfopila sp. IMCC35008]|uniref:L-serine ammonia-lyase, iron-sulfur-dependent, subunit alpha n=1 Tax=Desulfopila sp. IMCC35008 TaxID=2653858 RepID=UPI00197AC77C|nr:L-serine ammonia-lyase, iron-sulfur-dependent, subunit alpha [Desulfopila sp. IMCC35008]
MFVSVFNDVLGPVMRGPSSSHTAGSYHIALIARDLLGSEPFKIKIVFDPEGSYGKTYVQQGVDRAFVTGLMGWKQTDEIFKSALDTARKHGVEIDFELVHIPHADHPNYVHMQVVGEGHNNHLDIEAKSVGGGTFTVVKVNGVALQLDGKRYATLIEIKPEKLNSLIGSLASNFPGASVEVLKKDIENSIVKIEAGTPLDNRILEKLAPDSTIRQARPVYHTRKGEPPFASGTEMVMFALQNDLSLGQAVLEYEKAVLGLTEEEAISEMIGRYKVMKASVAEGLIEENVNMQLLEPMAGRIMEGVRVGRSAIGGVHARASAAAMAAMHTCNSQGVVCAAPTGGAAGTLPGILTVLEEEYSIDERRMALMLFAAGGIGLILAIRGTFAAEVAGCQVEIGAAGAMGASAVVEFAGGTVQQACDAAAISFQNTMGSVCDLVQGMCEIPCHTRNGVAASSAFTNADMVIAGYVNPIPLDETIDAVYSSGLMLPSELRCTAQGGLAIAPSAQALKRVRKNC